MENLRLRAQHIAVRAAIESWQDDPRGFVEYLAFASTLPDSQIVELYLKITRTSSREEIRQAIQEVVK